MAVTVSSCTRALLALSLGVGILALAENACAQAVRTDGIEATVPATPDRKDRFVLDYRDAKRFLMRDGDPQNPDSPVVLAVIGGSKVWFNNYFITADTILLWVDPESLSSGPEIRVESDDSPFPYGVQLPDETRTANPESFAISQDPAGPPPLLTTGRVREIYAEGNVYVSQEPGKIFQSERAYFNVLEDRSLIIQGELITNTANLSFGNATGGVGGGGGNAARQAAPIVIRAGEIRGVSKGLLEAQNAQVTTCTFAKPGYHIAMDRMVFEERAQEVGGKISGYDNRFYLGDTPLLTLPFFSLRTGVQSPLPLIGYSAGLSTQFGLFLETRWGNSFEDAGDDFNKWVGVDGTFDGLWFADLNFYSARGLGHGLGIEYETNDGSEKKYYGTTRFFEIFDYGDDETSPGKHEDNSGFRGQFKTQNRVFLPDDWVFDTELNYVSDKGFLKEFMEDEYDEEKAPETIAYLRKIEGDTEVSGLVRLRLNDWQTQTEYLPQFTYDIISRPIFEIPGFSDFIEQPEPVRAYWTHRSELGYVNRRAAKGSGHEEGSAFRVDDIERINTPFQVGDFGFDPYLENRFTAWMGDATTSDDSATREAMTFGFNASTQYWRTDPDVESDFWNIHGIRHILIPSLRYRWTFLSTEDSNDLIKYDSVEQFDEANVLVPGLLTRYETKRMSRFGPTTVTFLEYDIQQPFIFSNNKMNDPDLLGDLYFDATWRPDMDPYLLRNSVVQLNFEYNWNKSQMDRFRVDFKTEPGPDFYGRVAYSWAKRGRVSPTLALDGIVPSNRGRDLNSLTFEVGRQLTRNWEFVALRQFDLGEDSSRGGENRLLLRRSTHDWMFEFGFGSSGAGTGVGVTVTPIAFFNRDERHRFQSALSDNYDLTPIFDEPDYAVGGAFGSDDGYSDNPDNNFPFNEMP